MKGGSSPNENTRYQVTTVRKGERGFQSPIVTETSQLLRHSVAGPSKRLSISKEKTKEVADNEPDFEKQIIAALKKTPKEVITLEGKVAIVSQM